MPDPVDRAASRLDSLWDEYLRDPDLPATTPETRVMRRLQRIAASNALRPRAGFEVELRRRLLSPGKDLLPMITGIHHVVLFCTDTERSRDWYARAGFEYNRGYGGMHWFNAGPYEIMLHPAPSGPAGGAPHIHVATSDVDGMFRRVVAEGLAPIDHQQPDVTLDGPVTRPWGDREFELEDPDGNRIVVTQS